MNQSAVPEEAGSARVVFVLERDEDGYPPYETERVWAWHLPDGTYQIRNTPVFARGVSYGDVVRADERDGVLTFREVVRPSGHSTIRVIVEGGGTSEAEQALRALGCDVDGTRIRGLIAVDVPPQADYSAVLERLRTGRAERDWGIEEASVSPAHEASLTSHSSIAEGLPDTPLEHRGSLMLREREERAPWQVREEDFLQVAQRGRLHRATGTPAPMLVGSGDTPLSLGESEGYEPEDIAHFYVARRTRRWAEVTSESVRLAYEDYLRDAIYEGKAVPEEIAATVGLAPPTDDIPAGASVVPLPGDPTGMRWLAFSSCESARDWLHSIQKEVREHRHLDIERTGSGAHTRYWIVAAPSSDGADY